MAHYPETSQEWAEKHIVRVPVSGRQRGATPDILHPVYSTEVKHRQKLPKWLVELSAGFDSLRPVHGFPGLHLGLLKHLSQVDPGSPVIEPAEPVLIVRNLSAELSDAFDQVVKSAGRDGKNFALVILHQHRMQTGDSIVFLLEYEAIKTLKSSSLRFTDE